MRVKDAIGLAWENAKVFSKQSLKMILVMGVIFGVIFGLQFWFQGVKNAYVDFTNLSTDGRVVMTVSTDAESMGIELGQKMGVEEMLQDVGKYGEVVGRMEMCGLGLVLEEELVTGSIEVGLDMVPDGAVPILVSTHIGEQMSGYSYSDRAIRTPGQKLKAYEEYRARVLGKTFVYGDVEYFVVGLAPGGFHTTSLALGNTEKDRVGLSDVILEWMTIDVGGRSIAVRNGGAWEQSVEVTEDKYVVVFENVGKAYEFFEKGKGFFFDIELEGRGYMVEMVAGMAPREGLMIKVLQAVIDVACLILAMVAAVIMIFTSIGLIGNDKENIRLYYDLGATQKQVKVIYRWYFLWLMLGVIVISVLMAVIWVMLYSWINQMILQVTFVTAFSLVDLPRIVLLGVNYEVIGFVGLIMVMALVCVWVNRRGLKYSEGR